MKNFWRCCLRDNFFEILDWKKLSRKIMGSSSKNAALYRLQKMDLQEGSYNYKFSKLNFIEEKWGTHHQKTLVVLLYGLFKDFPTTLPLIWQYCASLDHRSSFLLYGRAQQHSTGQVPYILSLMQLTPDRISLVLKILKMGLAFSGKSFVLFVSHKKNLFFIIFIVYAIHSRFMKIFL